MTNLIPEKRLDKNGVLTTKHVRATPKAAATKVPLPAPVGTNGTKKFKPRAKQLLQYKHDLKLSSFPSDDPLTTAEKREYNKSHRVHTAFTANDVEVYDVLSATTSTGNALELLCAGVRSADEARAYLKEHGAESLIADRSDLTQAALERGFYPYDFMHNYELLSPEQRSSEFLMDGLAFMSTSLNEGHNAHLLREVFNGSVSYSDIKSLGITKLKTGDRGYELIEVLIKLNKGEANYTVDDLKEILDRATPEKKMSFHILADTMYYVGPEPLRKIRDLYSLDLEHYNYIRSTSSSKHDGKDRVQVYDMLTYAAQVKQDLTIGSSIPLFITDEFHEAGIPVNIAVEVINAGGTVNSARAIHEEGVNKSLASGWL